MPTFDYRFTIDAPQPVVLDFHHDTSVLKTLTPPPLFVQLHAVEPLGEGSKADFTIWFGPFPIRWQAVHSKVDDQGFTDTLVTGPLKNWQHRHQFVAINNEITQVNESIEYEFEKGVKGLVSRLMYSRASLTLLFTARKLITKKHLRTIMRSKNVHN
ncbi:MAG TPA: hypothetical protein VFI27_14050 [candidate division Zixibacteria bacterium]|nr:hypothetical protein [candidate division Zixibacteria bacterium]